MPEYDGKSAIRSAIEIEGISVVSGVPAAPKHMTACNPSSIVFAKPALPHDEHFIGCDRDFACLAPLAVTDA